MGFFDRFRKKSPDPGLPIWPQPPKEDTMCLLLMDRVLEDAGSAAVHLKTVFGDNAASAVYHSHSRVPAFTVSIDGL